MRGFLVLAGVLAIAAFAVAPPPTQEEDNANQNQPDAADVDSAEQADAKNEDQDAEDNVFASVETAATNADLAIKLMKQALGVLLESSANAMESTEELLRSGVHSVNSIASGAQAAAKQIGTPQEVKPARPQKAAPAKAKPERQRSGSWFW